MKYTKEEIIEKLKQFYEETKLPITCTKIKNCEYMPSIKVFNKMFSSIKNACLEANVPFSREKYIRKSSSQNKKNDRIGISKYNNQGCLMTCIEYRTSHDIIVRFEDGYKAEVSSSWAYFNNGSIDNPNFYKTRIGEESYNNQGCLMKIIEYNRYGDIVVEFQDNYKSKIRTDYKSFNNGGIKNPYYPSVLGIGIIGNKCPVSNNGKHTKEYATWKDMLRRCYNEEFKNNNPAYKNVTVCNEWLLYENFYKWLHSQENFDKWYNGDRWAVDKDILVKCNKIYSPETCCLVPKNVNSLFINMRNTRNNLPIGVHKKENKYYATTIYGKEEHTNCAKRTEYGYPTPEDAFYFGYKYSKEKYIKRIAQEEFTKENITKRCYDAMVRYEVEITD